MNDDLRPGLGAGRRIVVDRDRTIGFMGEQGRVYGTPHLIADIEQTCRDMLLEHCAAGQDSVGMEVSIRHLAPTLLNMAVQITARITAVEGRKVTFEVTASDDIEPICSGTHVRFVVEVEKLHARLAAKAAKRAAAKVG